MTTVVLDHSLLASAQSFAVGQRWKVLAEEGSSCINMSPYLHGSPSYPHQMSELLAAVGLPSSGDSVTQRCPHEERACARIMSQSEC